MYLPEKRGNQLEPIWGFTITRNFINHSITKHHQMSILGRTKAGTKKTKSYRFTVLTMG